MDTTSTDLILPGSDDETALVAEAVNVTAIGELNRSEVECQLDAAHKYPRFNSKRGIKQWAQEVLTLATGTREVAESCIYTLKRRGPDGKPKPIVGQSIRFAEIIASTWGNLQVASRIVAVDDSSVVSQGGAWDMEKNLRVVTETRRNILTKSGHRFSEDMITVTGNAAASIARRNAIFSVVPKAYRDPIFVTVRQVAAGSAKDLEKRKGEVIARLEEMGVKRANICPALGVASEADINIDVLTILIGFGTAIKEGQPIHEVFPDAETSAPSPSQSEEGRRMKLGEQKPSVKIEMPPEEPK